MTPDGRFVLFDGDGAVWMLPLSGASEPQRLVQGIEGRVSADGRWLAYTSSESGRPEVYVTAFPEPTTHWRVSTDGGQQPQWRADGRELFFLNQDRALVAAALSLVPRFEVTALQTLFSASLDHRSLRFGPSYAPAADGQRFLVNELVGDNEKVLTAMENWMPDGR